MGWTPNNFKEACRRAAGRRAYNRRRRLARQHRISAIILLQDKRPDVSGRELARALKVSESTVSRDLKFIRRVRRDYARQSWGARMTARSFRWLRGGGFETVFEIRCGVRVR